MNTFGRIFAIGVLVALAAHSSGAETVEGAAGMQLVEIPAGEFEMGSSADEVQAMFEVFHRASSETELKWFSNEEPKHLVVIKAPFFMGRTEVTQKQWREVMGRTLADEITHAKPGAKARGEGDGYPIYYVSWNEAKEFIRRLNARHDDFTYRLPSEAEWEYACRAGTTGRFYGELDAIAWYNETSGRTRLNGPPILGTATGEIYGKRLLENGGRVHPVATKAPNAFGVYDMSGNVWEWCEDTSHPDYHGAPADGSAWITEGPNEHRVVRGGSWSNDLSNLHSAYRSSADPSVHVDQHGLRIVARRRKNT
jgi:formylglycine-generating enzyme required for sulfatase activity